jgi:tetratricopeptide (TPR) repeat protein
LRGSFAGRYASGHEYLLYNERSQIIANCITQINAGNFRQPDADLTALLEEEPECYQALVARGTCRALAGSTKNSELRKAEADFTKAIKILPDLADVWKRRSQARAALGDFAGATKDLHDCLRQCASLY